MNFPVDPAAPLDPAQLWGVLAAVHAQVVAALWLSAGMGCALAMIASVALGWRRAALAAGFCYSLTLCSFTQGHAQVLGPCGCALSATGFLWPQRPARKGRPLPR